MLSHEIPLPLSVDAGQMDGTLPLDEPDHLRYRILRRYRDQYVHVVGHQVPFQNPALLLLRQLPEYLPKVRPQLLVDDLPPTFRNEDDVILTLPFGVA